MKFGVFDHMDFSGAPLHEQFEHRLKMVESYERAGMHGYHVAEHHCTPLGCATSPSVWLAAVAQRTTRLRLGPLIYILPLYHPLRLVEEVAMLDQMSAGRFMLGVGRGVSPIEASFYGVPMEEQVERYRECYEILLQGLSSERLTYQGKYYAFKDVPMTMRPFQKKPDVWYGGRTPESFAWAARHGYNVVTLAHDDKVRELIDIYRAEWLAQGNDTASMPLVGVSRHIVVAETDAEAKRIASRAYTRWVGSLRKLWLDQGRPTPLKDLYPDTWEELEALKNGCAGSPETVRRFALEEAERGTFNYLVSWFAFGDLAVEDVTRSVDLFSRHVMPAFR